MRLMLFFFLFPLLSPGAVSVDGGAGGSKRYDGYGAGGGRMSITYDNWLHTGDLTAYGGKGYPNWQNEYGQPGTIYLNSLSDPSETVLVLDTGEGVSSFGEFPFNDPNKPGKRTRTENSLFFFLIHQLTAIRFLCFSFFFPQTI